PDPGALPQLPRAERREREVLQQLRPGAFTGAGSNWRDRGLPQVRHAKRRQRQVLHQLWAITHRRRRTGKSVSWRRRLALGAVLALTLLLTSPLLALARAGGGQSFGGGGGGFSGGGGGFGGGGGGFGGGGLLLPFFLFGGGGGGFIFFLFIVFALYQAYRRMSIRNPVQ